MSILATMRDPFNTAAASAAMVTVMNTLPTILGVIAGIMGVAWYCVLFYDRFIAKGQKADDEEGA